MPLGKKDANPVWTLSGIRQTLQQLTPHYPSESMMNTTVKEIDEEDICERCNCEECRKVK